jgi:hypothetical protein
VAYVRPLNKQNQEEKSHHSCHLGCTGFSDTCPINFYDSCIEWRHCIWWSSVQKRQVNWLHDILVYCTWRCCIQTGNWRWEYELFSCCGLGRGGMMIMTTRKRRDDNWSPGHIAKQGQLWHILVLHAALKVIFLAVLIPKCSFTVTCPFSKWMYTL